jgi:hypothetical protein
MTIMVLALGLKCPKHTLYTVDARTTYT